MAKKHQYQLSVKWTGNTGLGTDGYASYERSHDIMTANKPTLLGSSDPSFRGDASKYNPEELLVASISSCHMLWYLHLCSVAGIVVLGYEDEASGTMEEDKNGSGRFTEVILHPIVTLQDIKKETLAQELHQKAYKMCFIANSLNFEVHHKPRFVGMD